MWLTRLNKMDGVPDAKQHQLLYGFFKGVEERPFCYKDTGSEIIMLSSIEPNTECKEIQLREGQTLMFECTASLNGRKHKDITIRPQDFTPDHIKEWFRRRLDGGAYVNYVSFQKLAPHKIRRDNSEIIILNRTHFYGTLTVMNAPRMQEIMAKGVGRGGAFGFGLIYLPQVME